MRKPIIIIFMMFFMSFSGVMAATDLLSCSFKDNSCSSGESVLLYANGNFLEPGFGRVLSSNIAITPYIGYTKPLCCKINPSMAGTSLGTLDVTYVDNTSNCPAGSEDLMYLTSAVNSRIAVKANITDFSHYSKKMCFRIPTDFTKLNIFVSTQDYSYAGYSCLYRVNNVTNGLISDCSAKFAAKQYPQIVWAKLIESSDSLKCNADCTSKLDGRVYSSCGAKIADCQFVSPKCDGSVYGAFVNNGAIEVQCSAPWSNTRNLAFTEDMVEVSSIDNKCSNVIQKKYSVMLNNELVTMSVYVCQEDQ